MECWMWSVGCGMLGVGCEMMDVECGIWNGACGTGMFSHRSQLDTETMRVALSKNTDFTDAHGWVFSRILYSCSAAHCLVLMRRRRKGSPQIFSHAENLSMRARLAGTPEGAEVHSPGQAKRRPGYNVLCSLRPVRVKVLKKSVLCLLLPLQGVV